MKISKLAQREARQLFRSCQAGGLLDENRVRQAVSLLVSKKPRGYVGILSRLLRLVQLDMEQHAARIESATPLPADLQADLASRITRMQPQLRVLYLGGYTDEAATRTEKPPPGAAMLRKPFEMETLFSRVRELLES